MKFFTNILLIGGLTSLLTIGQVNYGIHVKDRLVDSIRTNMKNYNFVLTKGGGFVIEVNGEVFFFETKITYPNKGWNCLLVSDKIDTGGERNLNVEIKQVSARKFEVIATGTYYIIVRTISLLSDRVDISDSITNRNNQIIGAIIRNQMHSYRKPRCVWLAGYPTRSSFEVEECAENPTILFVQDRSSCGLVVKDDIYRLQSKISYKRGIAESKTEQFGLDASASYRLCWSIYPMHSCDYFDFINKVRASWKVNFRIDGPFDFFSAEKIERMPEDKLQEWLSVTGLKIIALSPWLTHSGFLGRLDRNNFKVLMQKAITKIHKLDHTVKCLVMIHPAQLGLNLRELDETPYEDSRIITNDGVHFYSEEYSRLYFKHRFDQGLRLCYYYPATDNSFFKKLEHDIDFAMDSIGADGVYFDEFSFAFRRDYTRYTYDKWDGHTIELDTSNYTVKRKLADLGFITQQAQKQLITKVISKGGIVVANTVPATSTMQRVHIMRFVETGVSKIPYHICSRAHLSSPIGLGFPFYRLPPRKRKKEYLMRDILEKLNCGLLYYCYGSSTCGSSILKKFFPFIPIELHKGWVKGKNKIITGKSGLFGWQDNQLAITYLYDNKGNLTSNSFITNVNFSAVNTVVKLPRGNIAVIERIPIIAEPIGSPAKISIQTYNEKEISFIIKHGNKMRLSVHDGKFRIEPYTEYSIILYKDKGKTIETVVSSANTLTFILDFNGVQKLIIRKKVL